MKSRDEVSRLFEKWWVTDTVGNFIVYRAPGARYGDVILEQVVKAREMEPSIRAAFEMLMDELQIERAEMFRDKDGRPDRIKITRRYDG